MDSIVRNHKRRAVNMGKVPEMVVDKKFLLAMILVCAVLGGSFAFIYVDLKADFAALRDNYANLSAKIEQLQSTLEALHANQTANLTAVQIYNLTKCSVVLIANRRRDASGNLVTVAEGSGFVYGVQGHIITNNHVVEGAEDIRVTFLNGTVAQAQLMGRDVYSDLAVIKVNASEELLHPVVVGNSSALIVGETVYAIGNPFGLVGSITQGIVSQLGRSLRTETGYSIVDVIQIDAAINPGNSGGPLINSLGLVIGVNTAIATETGNFSGVGFAISSTIMQRVIPALIQNRTYEHPWIGVVGTDMSQDIADAMHTNYTSGFLITEVMKNSPAETYGLRGGSSTWNITIEGTTIKLGGDIIIGIDGRSVAKADDLLTYMERYKSPEEAITLTIVRDNLRPDIFLILKARPPH